MRDDGGMNYYAVKTTGVYCRRGCPSRTPRPENVVAFESAVQARGAGFRACKRCRPDEDAAETEAAFVQACRAIEVHDGDLPLERLAAMAHMSPWHFQRRFTRAVGVSPKAYAQAVKAARERRSGRGAAIAYTIVATALGSVLVAATARGICRVDIGDRKAELAERLRAAFPHAAFESESENETVTSAASLVVSYLAGNGPWPQLPIDVRASAFQARVWKALRDIPAGKTLTYTDLANAIGEPRAARAVARACASNPIALIIPCHRILPRSGGTGGYRWDPRRKERLLELERDLARR